MQSVTEIPIFGFGDQKLIHSCVIFGTGAICTYACEEFLTDFGTEARVLILFGSEFITCIAGDAVSVLSRSEND